MKTKTTVNDTQASGKQPDSKAAAMEQSLPNAAEKPDLGELTADDPNNVQQEDGYDLKVNGVDDLVRVRPFLFNDETRYYVSVNDGPTNLFLWNAGMNQIRSLDNTASILPDGLEKAISDRLMTEEKKTI